MKKNIKQLICACLALSVVGMLFSIVHAEPKPQACIKITQMLSLNLTDKKTNGQVSILQNYLLSEGFSTTDVLGYYGTSTWLAVRAWQNANNLNIPVGKGIFGPISRAFLEKKTCGDKSGTATSTTTSTKATSTTATTSTTTSTKATSTTATTSAKCVDKKIVILGSSSAAGVGADPISNSWANLYSLYIKSLSSTNSLVNLAIPGFTSYQVLPTGHMSPANRPSVRIDKNITMALSLHPDAIIVNLPTNDIANGYSLSETESNFKTIHDVASNSGVPIYFSTPQPRNIATSSRESLVMLKNWITNTYGSTSIDFWTSVAMADGTINPQYSYGDGIHLNNAGHALSYKKVVEKKVIESLCTSTTTNKVTATSQGGILNYISASVSDFLRMVTQTYGALISNK